MQQTKRGLTGSILSISLSVLIPLISLACSSIASTPPGSGICLSFDGSAFLTAPSSPPLDLTTNRVTLESWVMRQTGGSDWQVVLNKGTSGSPYGISIHKDGRVQFELAPNTSTSGVETDPGVISDNVWTHVAATYDGSQMRLYVNGFSVKSIPRTSDIPVTNDPFVVGGGNSTGSYETYAGLIDEIRIWNLARTPSEIQEKMKRSLRGDEPGLVANWRFDEGAGQEALDTSPNGITLRLGENTAVDTYDPTWTSNPIPDFLPVFTSAGEISLARNRYSCSSVIEVQLGDLDLIGAASATVELLATSGDSEALILLPASGAPGVLSGTLPTASGAATLGDGLLQALTGDVVTARYEDADDGTGFAAVDEATAAIDCDPPILSNIDVLELTGTGAVVSIQSNESVQAEVLYGLNCATPVATATSETRAADVTVILSGLEPTTQYRFIVRLTDESGNVTIDDNTGSCYLIETTSYPGLPFFDGFESGLVGPHWQISGVNDFRTRAETNFGPPSGLYHMVMDDAGLQSGSARNEATLPLNLADCEKVTLSFNARRFNDPFDFPPLPPIPGGADFDGVAISEDGQNWYEIFSLPDIADYRFHSIDLDQAAASFGLNFNSAFQIRFNQFGANPATSDGVGYDNVALTAEPKGGLSVQPTTDLVLNAPSYGLPNSNRGAYTLRNDSLTDINWVVGSSQPWVQVSPPSGTLLPGEIKQVDVTALDPAGLDTGEYPADLTFFDLTQSQFRSRKVRVVASSAGHAFSFEGGDLLRTPVVDALKIAGSAGLTIGAWIHPRTSTGSNSDLLAYSANSPFLVSMRSDGRLEFRLFFEAPNSEALLTAPAGSLPLEQWTHLYCIWDGAMMHIVINGEPVVSREASGNLRNPDGALHLSGDSFLGLIDEVSLWNRALEPVEYSEFLEALVGSEQGLSAYWKFNDGVGQTATDSTSNNLRFVVGRSGGEDTQDPEWAVSHIPGFQPPANSRGRVRFDRDVYTCADRVDLVLRDIDIAGMIPQIQVTTLPGGDIESVTLTEDALVSGAFRRELETQGGPSIPGDGIIQAQSGDIIQALYHDADDGLGATAVVSATADLDCDPPLLLSSIGQSSVAGIILAVTFDEPAAVTVRYGLSCSNLDQEVRETRLQTEHILAVRNLSPETAHFFIIEATDVLGNFVVYDQGGICFSATTSPIPRPPLLEDFETGDFRFFWGITGTNNFRTQVTSSFSPYEGGFHMTMDSTEGFSRNEATLFVNLENQEDVILTFAAREYSDETHSPPPSPFQGGADFDGVAVSVDGENWYEVFALRGLSNSYQIYTVDLDQVMATHGLTYSSVFRIRFNQYDNGSLTGDGVGIDYISLTGETLDDLVVSPEEDFESLGRQGGTFTPDAMAYVVRNTGESPVRWSVVTDAPWLNISPIAGTLISNATTEVVINPNVLAQALPVGIHSATVTFANLESGIEFFRNARVRISPPCTSPREPILNTPLDGATDVFSETLLKWEWGGPVETEKVLVFNAHVDLAPGGEFDNTLTALTDNHDRIELSFTASETTFALEEDLKGQTVFLFPEQESWSVGEVRSWAVAVGEVLREFVELGGIILATDDDASLAEFLDGAGLIPGVRLSGPLPGVPADVVKPTHPIMNGVANPFYMENGYSTFDPISGDLALAEVGGRPVILANETGLGAVIALSADFFRYNVDMARVLANAVSYRIGSACPSRYDIYMDTANPPVTLVQEDSPSNICDPGPLQRNTTYFWRVIAKDCCGETAGPVWSFRTEDCAVPLMAEGPGPIDGSTTSLSRESLDWVDLTPYTPIENVQVLTLTSFVRDIPYVNILAALDMDETDFSVTSLPFPVVEGLEAELAGKDVFLLPDQRDWSESEFRNWGSNVAPTVEKFVMDGGGLIAMSTYGAVLEFLKEVNLIPQSMSRAARTTANRTTSLLIPSHPVFEGIPSQFILVGANAYFTGGLAGNNLATRTNQDAPNLVYLPVGRGFVLLMGWDYSTSNTVMDQILRNAVELGGNVRRIPRYDVLFGETNPPTVTIHSSLFDTMAAWPSLLPGSTYYWRVLTTNDCGTTASPVWSFQTESCDNPPSVGSPVPIDSEVFAPVKPTLSWSLEKGLDPGVTTYDLYFGPDNPPTSRVAEDLAETSFALDTLSYQTTYFWRVAARNNCGSSDGSVWSFTTEKKICEDGYYILDSYGNRYRVGTPPQIDGDLMFAEPVARAIDSVVAHENGTSTPDLAVLDGFGVVHFVEHTDAVPPQEFQFPPNSTFPLGRAVDFVFSENSQGFWVLADYGGIYRAGQVKDASDPALIPGTDLMGVLGYDVPFGELRASTLPNPGGASLRAVRLMVVDHDSDGRAEGYVVLDSQGGPHFIQPDGSPFLPGSLSGLPADHPLRLLDPSGHVWPYFPGLDILRSAVLHSSGRGALVMDGWGGLHPIPVDSEANPVYFATNRVSNSDPTYITTVGMPYVQVGFDDPATTGIDEGDPSVYGIDAASIFKEVAFSFCEGGLYTMDRFGAVFTFGTARPIESELSPRFGNSPFFFPNPISEDLVFYPRQED